MAEQNNADIDALYLGVVQDEDTSTWKKPLPGVDFKKRINTIVYHEYTDD